MSLTAADFVLAFIAVRGSVTNIGIRDLGSVVASKLHRVADLF